MHSVRIKAYAKINLTLHVLGVRDGFHALDSVVASVDLYDVVTIKKRKDRRVCITMRGTGSEAIPYEDNNAVKAAKLFIERFETNGADITVDKNIPMGAGLGGSSADAAGVLNGLSKLYGKDDIEALKELAARTGSDTPYMLEGGWARLFGRGDVVKRIDSRLKLYALLLAPEKKVSTAECFQRFDAVGGFGGNSDGAERAAIACDKKALSTELSNSLLPAAVSLSESVAACVAELKELNPLAVNMTGSGSGVYALFENKKFCARALSRFKGEARAYILEVK